MTNSIQTIAVNIPKKINLKITHEQFVELAKFNRDLQLERTAKGKLIVMAQKGGDTGNRNSNILGQLWLWNRQTKLGKTFDYSSGFHLSNGSSRSPDAAWVKQERWDALTREQQEIFAPLCPDFVVELRSKNDTFSRLQKKMKEYQSNGARLGWLIDSKNLKVEIYRQNQEVEVLKNPNSLSGEDVLPGFVLDLMEVWN
ncbi:MAG: Uma2 family endonuclease [Okeania sp. SIO2C9]|uniref:Uma2 family endonuclease n=1 Tax=Okeania sp. SIO2C9 TaxID=2607791 RepID=UPI0013C050A1|nr:Uma2 family endonuclease [Okeania sp. SIO2C9]NEQ77542.1 Uma2 family endonuclease [Okeania sp. SIO2C9]